jgi:nucleoside-diphosphate-sugar epimerase
MSDTKKELVTGAGGFIGSHLVKRLSNTAFRRFLQWMNFLLSD